MINAHEDGVGGANRHRWPLRQSATSSRRLIRGGTSVLLAVMALVASAHVALAGGGPQNVLLVVDPMDGDALQVANHYQAARGIPSSNVLYLNPTAADYRAFVEGPRAAVLEKLRQPGVVGHIDYIVVPSGHAFYLPAAKLITGYINPRDGKELCAVSRISLTGAWTLANEAEAILAGPTHFTETNQYYANTDTPTAFDADTTWLRGRASSNSAAQAYLLGFQLGYSGERGNTVTETLAMIDRSVAADGSRPKGAGPDGTFYFMKNADVRSKTRTPFFQTAVDGLFRNGGKAEIVDGGLPTGRHDALGILAGNADLAIRDADLTLLPGAYADHLTSFAATFDVGSQTKLSEWITKGASGSMGTVDEPCVFGSEQSGEYQEKFPHPRLFTWYFQGLSLGEALFRSIPWAPFQGLFYGDPLTQPFAAVPRVTVTRTSPGKPVAGLLTLRPQATGEAGLGPVTDLDLFVDGRLTQATRHSEAFTINTQRLDDGWHDLRVVAYGTTEVRTQGSWQQTVEVRNHPGRTLRLTGPGPESVGNAILPFEVAATGGDVVEIRLEQNGRVLAATYQAAATMQVAAAQLGADHITVIARATYADDVRVTSAPFELTIPRAVADAKPAQSDHPPVAYSYTREIWPGAATLLDLAAMDEDTDSLTRTILTPTQQADLKALDGAFVLKPRAGASGTDELSFQATDSTGLKSDPATIRLRYCESPVIHTPPVGASVCLGTKVELKVVASAETPMTYQWYKDGVAVMGAIEDRLVIKAASPADAGTYTVAVESRCDLGGLERLSGFARVQVSQTGSCRPKIFMPYARRR